MSNVENRLVNAAEGELHSHCRMSNRRHGKQISRAVPKEEYGWITEATNNYREYRKIVRSINKLNDQIDELFCNYGEKLVEKSSKGKPYLIVENFGNKNEKVFRKIEEMSHQQFE